MSDHQIADNAARKDEAHRETLAAFEPAPGKSYEEANWARLSPNFRRAHNRLRQIRGQAPIPEPKIDLYVAPRAPLVTPFDPTNPEFVTAARQFLGPTMMGNRGDEAFTINGKVAP